MTIFQPRPDRPLTGEIEPWRCTGCDTLMYNLDEEGKPAPGAPTPRWWSMEHPKLCSLCYEMEMAAKKKEE